MIFRTILIFVVSTFFATQFINAQERSSRPRPFGLYVNCATSESNASEGGPLFEIQIFTNHFDLSQANQAFVTLASVAPTDRTKRMTFGKMLNVRSTPTLVTMEEPTPDWESFKFEFTRTNVDALAAERVTHISGQFYIGDGIPMEIDCKPENPITE